MCGRANLLNDGCCTKRQIWQFCQHYSTFTICIWRAMQRPRATVFPLNSTATGPHDDDTIVSVHPSAMPRRASLCRRQCPPSIPVTRPRSPGCNSFRIINYLVYFLWFGWYQWTPKEIRFFSITRDKFGNYVKNRNFWNKYAQMRTTCRTKGTHQWDE